MYYFYSEQWTLNEIFQACERSLVGDQYMIVIELKVALFYDSYLTFLRLVTCLVYKAQLSILNTITKGVEQRIIEAKRSKDD